VTCNLGSIASGSGAAITLVLTAAATGQIINTASASSSTIDPVVSNNSHQAVFHIYEKPRISDLDYNSGAGTFSFSIPTAGADSFRVEYKDQLTELQWTTLTIVPADGDQQIVTDPGPLPPTRFYRIVAE
jgi:hypothetical protein